jgi:hypothetical protein
VERVGELCLYLLLLGAKFPGRRLPGRKKLPEITLELSYINSMIIYIKSITIYNYCMV